MHLVKVFETKNKYRTKNWDTEHTFKYLFDIEGILVEVGYFIHFKNGKEVKKVIELSSSYGCPMKCKFCASERIENFKIIDSNQLLWIMDYIFLDNKLNDKEKLVVAITGIGDLFFTIKNVVEFINKAILKYSNIMFDVSTIKLNANILKELAPYKDTNILRNIQITFVLNNDKIKELIPYMQKESYLFEEIVKLIEYSDFSNYRINYVMMREINDDIDTIQEFVHHVIPIKDKVKVRISRVNETKASGKYNILPPSTSNMEKLSELLTQSGIQNYIFYSVENDNMNCGQLISEVCK